MTVARLITYFGNFVFGFFVTLVAWFSFRFFCLAHLALQNVNKDYVIFSYFCNFVAKSDQKRKMGWTKQKSKDFTIGWNKWFFKKPSSKLVCTWEFVYNCTTGRRSLKYWFYFAFFFSCWFITLFRKRFFAWPLYVKIAIVSGNWCPSE